MSCVVVFFKQKTAYEMRISDWSSDVCSSDLGMQSWWEEGKEIYYTRFGQLNLACASCHEENNGRYIRADHLSQGNVNGLPTYRLKQANMVSLHNRFREIGSASCRERVCQSV